MTNSENTTFTVYMYEQEKEYLKWLVLQRPKIETGGDLFGLWRSTNTAIVQLIIGPGKCCYRTETAFYQDINYLSSTGKELTSFHGLCNIGEWHSHHRIALATPSKGDQNTVWKHMATESGGRFLLFIASISGSYKHPNVNIGCFLFSSKTRIMYEGSMVSLPGSSPIRTRFNDVSFKPGPEKGVSWDHFLKAVTADHKVLVNDNSSKDKTILASPQKINQNKSALAHTQEHHHEKTISRKCERPPKENTENRPSSPREINTKKYSDKSRLASNTTPTSYGSLRTNQERGRDVNRQKKQRATKHLEQTTATGANAITTQPMREVVSPPPSSAGNDTERKSSIGGCCRGYYGCCHGYFGCCRGYFGCCHGYCGCRHGYCGCRHGYCGCCCGYCGCCPGYCGCCHGYCGCCHECEYNEVEEE